MRPSQRGWLLLTIWLDAAHGGALGRQAQPKGHHRRRLDQIPDDLFSTQAHVHTLVHKGKAKTSSKADGKAGKRFVCGGGGKAGKGGKGGKANMPTVSPSPTASPTMSNAPSVFCTDQPTYIDENGNVAWETTPYGDDDDDDDGTGMNDDGTGTDNGDGSGTGGDGTGTGTGDNGDGSGTGDNGDGNGTGDNGDGSGTGDNGDGSGTGDNGDGNGNGSDNGDGTGTGDNGDGTSTGDNGDGTGTGDNGDGSGTGDNGDGTGTGDNGDGTGTGDNGDGTGTGDNGDGTGTGNGSDNGDGSGTGDNGDGSSTGQNPDETLDEQVERLCRDLTNSIYPEEEVDNSSYNIDLQLLLEPSADQDEVLRRLQELFQLQAAPNLSMCTAVTRHRRRRLQTAGILGAAFFPVHDDDSLLTCETEEEGDCLNVDVETIVYYAKGSDPSAYGQFVYDEVVQHCPAIRMIEGVIDAYDPCPTILLTPVDDEDGILGGPVGTGKPEPDDVAGVARVSSDDGGGLRVGGIVGISLAGALIVLLFMLLAVRRKRKDEYNFKHHTLVELDQDTYLNDNHLDSQSTASRNFHVVGEADSVFSGWTGYSGQQSKSSGLTTRESDKHTRDVHQCSSATCDVCERRRRQGLQFVPTMPAHHSHDVVMLSDTRDYLATDTVEL